MIRIKENLKIKFIVNRKIGFGTHSLNLLLYSICTYCTDEAEKVERKTFFQLPCFTLAKTYRSL